MMKEIQNSLSANKVSAGKKLVTNSAFPVIVLFVAMIIVNAVLTPGGMGIGFFTGFFTSNMALTCVAIGTSVVIIGGGIDISLGMLITLVNVSMTQMVVAGMSMPLVIVLAFVIALGGGALNGLIIAILRVSPMLASFATMSIFAGLALWIMPLPGGSMPPEFRSALMGTVGGVIPTSLILILISLGLTILVFLSPLGTKIRVTGWDPNKAFQSGIRTSRVQFFNYVFAGLIAGIGAIGLTANMGSGDPSVGTTFSMNAIASCVIGGVALSGGTGNTLGAMFGALFLGMLMNTIAAANVPSFYQSLANGVILLVGMIGAAMIVRKTSVVKQ